MAHIPTPDLYLAFIPSLGPLEIGIIFVIVLILFGPGKLPDVFRVLGDGVKQFKKASKDVTDELTSNDKSAATQEKTDPSDKPAS